MIADIMIVLYNRFNCFIVFRAFGWAEVEGGFYAQCFFKFGEFFDSIGVAIDIMTEEDFLFGIYVHKVFQTKEFVIFVQEGFKKGLVAFYSEIEQVM